MKSFVKHHSYNLNSEPCKKCGRSKRSTPVTNGLYCDIDGKGQAYNVQLFLQALSGKSLTGRISISTRYKSGWIQLKHPSHYNKETSWQVMYTHNLSRDKFFWLVSLDPEVAKNKYIWVKVIPNTKKNNIYKKTVKMNREKSNVKS